MSSIKLDCPDCGHVFDLALVKREEPPEKDTTVTGYAWYRRGDSMNDDAVGLLSEFLSTEPTGVRMTVAKLYERYWDFVLKNRKVAFSVRNFAVALRDLGHVPYRGDDVRGFVLGGAEAAAQAVGGGSYQQNVDRAIEQAKSNAKPDEEWWK